MPDIEDFETIEYWEQNVAEDQYEELTAEGEANPTDFLAWLTSPQGLANLRWWFDGLWAEV